MRLDGLSLAYRSPYLFPLRPTFGEMRARLEERLAERTRIAQDLHDTVLQGILSAAMQLHVAVDQLPANSPAKLRLSRVLELMGHVMEEGRNAVRGLRSSNSDSDDLGQAFSRIPQELGIEVQIDFRVIVVGSSRKLHPVIRDEVYRIGCEALVNAFRHSRATSIEVELEYAARHFRIVVSDNGCGIDPQVLRSGCDGHWGLPSMRERAERVGARLRVWSRAAAGTEVELSVPSSIAFESRIEKLAGC
jgi:signal transduction histidine kinase